MEKKIIIKENEVELRKKQNFKIKFIKLIFIIIFSVILISEIFNIVDFIIRKNKFKVNFVYVGQGDGVFIETGRKTIIIDGGEGRSKKREMGLKQFFPYVLRKRYSKVDYMFISHFDSDHYGGAYYILKNIRVGKIYIPKQKKQSKEFKDFMELAKKKNVEVEVLSKGDEIKIDDNVVFKVFWPETKLVERNWKNNNSLVFLGQFFNTKILFTGDIEYDVERKIAENFNKQKLDILFLAHHGSKSSSSEEFLKKFEFKNAICSSGKNNMFNHPNRETMDRLKKYKINLFRTDVLGEINIDILKDSYMIKSHSDKKVHKFKNVDKRAE